MALPTPLPPPPAVERPLERAAVVVGGPAEVEAQLMLELINRERTAAGLAPLAGDPALDVAAERHARWMVAGGLGHAGEAGSTPRDRMLQAGYRFSGAVAVAGENVAWVTQRDWEGPPALIPLLHDALMRSPGHRANILSPRYRQVGIGFTIGQGPDWRHGFVAEDFASTAAGPFLTGVVYMDRDGDGTYDAGEGLGGMTVTVTTVDARGRGRRWTCVTRAAGGYDLALPPGDYEVAVDGVPRRVSLSVANVKADFVARLAAGTLVAARR